MYQDSIIAEKVMILMLERGAVVLPVHDSFIVSNSYDLELEEVMKNVFEDQYGKNAKLKFKRTMLEEKQEELEAQGKKSGGFVTDDLEELYDELVNNHKWSRGMWGEL